MPKHESSTINWFPGHMNRAMDEIKRRMALVNLIIEVRDARSPLVTGNQAMTQLIGQKSHLIICNKTDLADPGTVNEWRHYFAEQGPPQVLFVQQNQPDLKKVVTHQARDIVHRKRLTSNPQAKVSDRLKLMIIGLPNTGKSSLINRLAGRNATKVANKPGQTQRQLWVNADPTLEILDTPGVMPPHIECTEHGLWLAALHAIPDHIVRAEQTACYLVEHFIDSDHRAFAQHFKIDQLAQLSLIEALDHIARVRGCLHKGGEYDYERVYQLILNEFRAGKFGPVSLGKPPS